MLDYKLSYEENFPWHVSLNGITNNSGKLIMSNGDIIWNAEQANIKVRSENLADIIVTQVNQAANVVSQ